VFIWQDAGNKATVADKVRQELDYDTSSGDSGWVRQYLEWVHPIGAYLADDEFGSSRINVRKADAA